MNLKKQDSLLIRLSTSYLVVILIGTILTSITANFMLEKLSDSQIINYNTAVVNALKDYVRDDVICGTDKLYIKIASETGSDDFILNSFEKDDISYRDIKRIMDYMNEVVIPESDWLDDMYIYFSRAGVIIGPNRLLYKRSAQTIGMPAWLNEFLEMDGDYMYFPTEPSSYEKENAFLLARKYPLIKDSEAKGYIIFKINEAVIAKILSQTDLVGEGEYRVIIDRNGKVIASTKNEKYPVISEEWKKFFERNKESNGYAEITQNDVRYVVTYSTVEPYGWRLMSVCPKSAFYKTSKYMQLCMLFVCILTIVLAFAVSEYYKKKIYSPIKSIVDKVGGMRKGESDEYGTISAAINDMSYKILDLQTSVDVARFAVKRDLILSLCLDKSLGPEMQRLIEVCDFDTSKKAYISVIFRIDKDITENLTGETVAKLIRSCIYSIESMTDENTQYIAGVYAGNKIVLIGGFAHADENVIRMSINKINDMIYETYYLSFVSVAGILVRRYEDIKISFESAKDAERYSMFSKNRNIIYATDVLKLDDSQLMMDERIMEAFKKNFFAFNVQAVKDDIKKIIEELSGKGYSASYRNTKLLEVANVISSYLKNNDINSYDIIDVDLITFFNEMDNVYEYEEWIYSVIEKIAEKFSVQTSVSDNTIIEKVKEYIQENLSSDISLSTVSESVYISSQYLCKIFRDETGMNFTDYVTQVRMEKAKEYLLETNMNIESVAENVGYKTPHYFTKKFKERFGMTPKSFRMNNNSIK